MRSILFNCKGYTMDSQDSSCSVIEIIDGKIAYVGNDLPPHAEGAAFVDMKGTVVLPGFSDTHMHMLNYAYLQTVLRLFGVDSIRKIQQMGRDRLAEHPLAPGQWLFGRGWNHEIFQEGRIITRKDLDEISAEVPIFIVRVCGHIAALNTPAMELLMASDHVDEYRHHIDEENGLLTETAIHYCYTIMPPKEKEFIKGLVRTSQNALHACGITAIGSDDFISLPGQNRRVIFESLCEMDRDGELTLRVQEQCAVVEPEDLDTILDYNRTFQPSEHLKMDVVKIVLDGSLGARTALFHDPYADDSSTCGTKSYTEDELEEMISKANRNGYQIAVHAIGDAACEMVIDACAKALSECPRQDHRHGIVHFEIADDRILKKARNIGMVGYIQPVFLSSDMDMLEKRLGFSRAQNACRWKSMRQLRIPISGGSDAPIESFDVLDNIFCAVSRKRIHSDNPQVHNPSECLSVKDAVALFTCDPPYMSFDETKRGTIETGKFADLTVLSEDPFNIPADQIPDIQILATMVDGKFVYQVPEFNL